MKFIIIFFFSTGLGGYETQPFPSKTFDTQAACDHYTASYARLKVVNAHSHPPLVRSVYCKQVRK